MTSAMPAISIVVLNLNKSFLTLECLDSIAQSAENQDYEIILVDNGSRADEAAALRCAIDPAVKLISLTQNMGFGEGSNIGVEFCVGRFLLFLNNDVVLPPGAIQRLVATFESSFSPGAVGPTLLYPDGSVQEAGAFVKPNGLTFQIGKQNIPIAPHFPGGSYIVDYCSAACLLVERHAFLDVGGFDPAFDPAYFEDVDFCLKLRARGLYTYCASDISVIHHENATSASLWRRDQIDVMVARNHQVFLRQWSGYLEDRFHHSAGLPQDPSTDAPPRILGRVLIDSAAVLRDTPESAALLRCAAALQAMSDLTIAVPEICSRLRVQSLCRTHRLELRDYRLTRSDAVDRSSYDHVIPFFESADGRAGECLRVMTDVFDRLCERSKNV